MERGIKETLELLEALKILSALGKEVASDGKITVSDLLKLVKLGPQMNELTEAFKGLHEIPLEAKDLDQQEVNQIIAKVFEIVSVFRHA